MRRPITAALVFLLLLSAGLYGQRYSFKRYDQSSGLPNQSIRTLLQDRAGFLWIGTDNGLYRYDGRRYRTFSAVDGLPAARVDALHQTNDGTIWVGTSSGLARLRGERFEPVDIAGGRYVLGLGSDGMGRLFVGSGKGLLVSGKAAGVTRKPEFRVYSNPGQESQVARGIFVSESGLVWYGCGRQVCRWDGERVDSRAEWGVPDDLWEAVLIDPQGNVWARSRTMLIELPRGETSFRRRDRGLPPAATDGRLLLGRDGQLWVPTIRGLARRTASGWDIIGKSRGLPISSVECALEDREGSIWIGLNGAGLVRSLGFSNWESWTEAEGLSAESVWGIRRDGAGVLWSINDVGLNRFNEARGRWEELKLPGVPAAQTIALLPAPDGSLWVGQVSGALHIPRDLGKPATYGRESGLANPWITGVSMDPDGGVWLGTPGGLYRSVIGRAGKSPLSRRFEREKLPLERGPDFILAILTDRRGRLWVGTAGGLLRREAGEWSRFTTGDGLLHNTVARLAEAKDGSLWIGYKQPVGISHLLSGDGRHLNWRHFSRKDGLRSEKCYSVGVDSRGWVWFGTDLGVDVFDGRGFRHFDHTDGLAWDDTNGNAFWADPDGSVWIGTGRGISHVRIPAQGLPQRPAGAPVLLTSTVFGDHNMSLSTGLSIPWSQRSLHIGFAAMTFVNEESVRFRYRIAGLEERWSETRLGEVDIPGLPAGRYTFEVQASARPGAADGAPARIAFAVQAAWWRTWWFDLAALAVAALLAHQLWAWRLRAILKRQAELENAVADRTRNLQLEKLRAEAQKVEIERLFRESQQAARIKDQFMANMSHEIRTPMNGIMGMTALALETSLTAEHREFWDTVRTSSEALVDIVDDIMDFSNVEGGNLDWAAAVFELQEVVNAAARNVALPARLKRLEVECHIGAGVPRQVVGDPVRLRQVLVNLLKNAVKFTERGRIVLRLNLEEDAESPLLHFEVADTGIGISSEMQSLIFEPFFQGDGSLTRRYGGTGLGLTVCARFVEIMDGRIWVESEPGRGSRFHFTARFQRAPDSAPAEVPSPSQPSRDQSCPAAAAELEPKVSPAGSSIPSRPGRAALEPSREGPGRDGSSSVIPLTILLAEDNLVNQKVAVRLLEKRGHRVVTAANGKEAVAAFGSQAFDGILMDLQMPEMDGYEATAEIRARERQTGAHITIVALTAHTMPSDRERCLQAGLDEYVPKPIRPADLFAAIENRERAPAAPLKKSPATSSV